MRPQTFNLAVQIDSRGDLSYHQWRAIYTVNGRQVPNHEASGPIPDAGYLAYVVGAFVDQILLARREQDPTS